MVPSVQPQVRHPHRPACMSRRERLGGRYEHADAADHPAGRGPAAGRLRVRPRALVLARTWRPDAGRGSPGRVPVATVRRGPCTFRAVPAHVQSRPGRAGPRPAAPAGRSSPRPTDSWERAIMGRGGAPPRRVCAPPRGPQAWSGRTTRGRQCSWSVYRRGSTSCSASSSSPPDSWSDGSHSTSPASSWSWPGSPGSSWHGDPATSPARMRPPTRRRAVAPAPGPAAGSHERHRAGRRPPTLC